MEPSDKISFEQYLKAQPMEKPEGAKQSDIKSTAVDEALPEKLFYDEPRPRDFTVFVLVLLTLMCIGFCAYYCNAVYRPVSDAVFVKARPISETAEKMTAGYKNGRININTADIDTLCKLNGIGKSKALSIAAYREANGPFHNPREICQVSGIGEKIYQNIKNDICV